MVTVIKNLFIFLFPNFSQTGDSLVAQKHPKSEEVKKIKDNLNKQWAELNEKAHDKGNKLRQASAQHTLNRALDDAQVGAIEGHKGGAVIL